MKQNVFCLNRLGKNFITDQFSIQALAVKEGGGERKVKERSMEGEKGKGKRLAKLWMFKGARETAGFSN